MILSEKQTVTLDSGLVITVDLNRANTPAARRALHKNDRHGDAFGLLDFLELAIGSDQLDRLIRSLEGPDGEPGTDAELAEAVREMFDKLKENGKKS